MFVCVSILYIYMSFCVNGYVCVGGQIVCVCVCVCVCVTCMSVQ